METGDGWLSLRQVAWRHKVIRHTGHDTGTGNGMKKCPFFSFTAELSVNLSSRVEVVQSSCD